MRTSMESRKDTVVPADADDMTNGETGLYHNQVSLPPPPPHPVMTLGSGSVGAFQPAKNMREVDTLAEADGAVVVDERYSPTSVMAATTATTPNNVNRDNTDAVPARGMTLSAAALARLLKVAHGTTDDPAALRRNNAWDEDTLVAALEQQVAAGVGARAAQAQLQQDLHDLTAQRAKTIANVKAKKALLLQTQTEQAATARQLMAVQAAHDKLVAEQDALRVGLQTVSAVRDDLKSKLRAQQELLKETRVQQEATSRRLASLQKERDMERTLLEAYRKLSLITGYQHFGKQIRQLESELAKVTGHDESA